MIRKTILMNLFYMNYIILYENRNGTTYIMSLNDSRFHRIRLSTYRNVAFHLKFCLSFWHDIKHLW